MRQNLSKIFVVVNVILATFFVSHARMIAYISNADSREISVLELDEKNGNLQLIEQVSVSGNVMPLAISPNRKFLFASLRSEPFSVSSFAINQKNGKLNPVKTTLLADNMAYLSTDRTGRFLLASSYSGNKISINSINKNGEISAEPLQIIPTGKNAHCILTDFSNRFLFVSNLGDDKILQFKFDEKSGNVSPNGFTEAKKGSGPRHFVFHQNQRFVFAVNELDASVSSYSLNNIGSLQLLETQPLMSANSTEKPWASDIHLLPNGKFLYATERTTRTISAFRVDEKSGKLTFIERLKTESQPRGFNISPDGQFLIAVGQKSNSASLYRIDKKSGKLRFLSKLAVGKNPNWVEIIKLPK